MNLQQPCFSLHISLIIVLFSLYSAYAIMQQYGAFGADVLLSDVIDIATKRVIKETQG